jgi:hypothetical protein
MCFRCDLKSRLLTGATANGLRLDAEECAYLSECVFPGLWRTMGGMAELTAQAGDSQLSDEAAQAKAYGLLRELCDGAKGNRQMTHMNPETCRVMFVGLATWMLRELGEGERLVEAFR